MTMQEIIADYVNGEINLEECNEKLKEFGLSLNPIKNIVVEGGAVAKENPAEINGYALLDCGLGTKDKVMIKDGKLVNASASAGDLVVIGKHFYPLAADGVTLNPEEI